MASAMPANRATTPVRPRVNRWSSSFHRARHAEAIGPALLFRATGDARGGANIARIIFPRSAAHYASIAIWTQIGCPVSGRVAAVLVRPAIFHPFPDVSMHVVQAKFIGGKTTHQSGLLPVHAGRADRAGSAAVEIRLVGSDSRPE